MSKKATRVTRAAGKALAASNKAAEEAKMASKAAGLAKDAIRAAVAAMCASERADASHAGDAPSVKKAAGGVQAATEEAVEHARDAMRAEDRGDAAGAAYAANLSVRAAQRAAVLSATVGVLAGKTREMASQNGAEAPRLATPGREESHEERAKRELAEAIDRASRYFVTRNGRIVAAFSNEEDAFLFESELADIDRARGAKSGWCEVFDRRSGRRLGGYLMVPDRMIIFERDEKHERRYSSSRGRRG